LKRTGIFPTALCLRAAPSNDSPYTLTSLFRNADVARLVLSYIIGAELVHLRRVSIQWRNIIPSVPVNLVVDGNSLDWTKITRHLHLISLTATDAPPIPEDCFYRLHSLVSLTLYDHSHFDSITKLSQLSALRFPSGIFFEEDAPSISSLQPLTNLSALEFSSSSMDLSAMTSLSRLKSLSVSICAIPNIILTQLTHLESLRTETDMWIWSERPFLSLHTLELECKWFDTPEGIFGWDAPQQLSSLAPSLSTLRLTGDISEHVHLSSLTNLKHLELRYGSSPTPYMLRGDLPRQLERFLLSSESRFVHSLWSRRCPAVTQLVLINVCSFRYWDYALLSQYLAQAPGLRLLRFCPKKPVEDRYLKPTEGLRLDGLMYSHMYFFKGPKFDCLFSLTSLTHLTIWEDEAEGLDGSVLSRLTQLSCLELPDRTLNPNDLISWAKPLSKRLKRLVVGGFSNADAIAERAVEDLPDTIILVKKCPLVVLE
jgi:hypothetical protein